MIIQASLNGSRTKSENRNTPVYTVEIVNDSFEVINAGADEIHFHVRKSNGEETLDEKFVSEQVLSVKRKLPQTPIGISTGGWIEPVYETRKQKISEWKVCPDFASVNVCEPGWEGIMEILHLKGIGIEAGICEENEALSLIEAGIYRKCFRAIIQPQHENITIATTVSENIAKIISPYFSRLQILLHGVNGTAWHFLELAFRQGYCVRVGIEDMLIDSNGNLAFSNKDLVIHALDILRKYRCT